MACAVGVAGLISSPPQRFLRRDSCSLLSGFRSGKTASLVSESRRTFSVGAITARALRPVVERFKIVHEKNVSAERLKELGVDQWSTWECGPCVNFGWAWEVDELVYITKGSVQVIPEGCEDCAFFYAGDLVRFPKWLQVSLNFMEDYEQRYKFLAYGD